MFVQAVLFETNTFQKHFSTASVYICARKTYNEAEPICYMRMNITLGSAYKFHQLDRKLREKHTIYSPC